ncbi:hypothetical protein Tco_0012082 [Tanacetum coccineum]
MTNFSRLQELAAVGNSNNLTDAMSVYIQREINADLQFAVGLSQFPMCRVSQLVVQNRSAWDVGAKEDDSGCAQEADSGSAHPSA